MSERLDPITFEVIRHKLWQITDEMGISLIHVSGSPIVTDANDIASGIFLPNGDAVSMGPYIMQHLGAMPFAIKSIIRECTKDPGIEEGDAFFLNDPWLGAMHQNDVVVAAPIHFEGKLVAWSGCMAHQLDVGGMAPGSYSPKAHEVYQEGIRFTPVKLVEGGVLRSDIFKAFINNTRVPQVGLDIKGEIAANYVAKDRLTKICERYGRETVSNAFGELISFSERKLRTKLLALPDGVFSHRDYIDHDGNSNKVYEIKLAMSKKRDRLAFDFAGTSPQASGFINCVLPGCVGGVLAALTVWLCYDMPWNQGIVNCIDVNAPEGTVVNAVKPAPVAMASIGASWVVKTCASMCISKILSASEDYRNDVMAGWMGGVPLLIASGINQYGERYALPFLDAITGGCGAVADHDGMDAAGDSFNPTLIIPNIETHEYRYPLLYIFRRLVKDSGGAGKYRGGVGCELMFVPHIKESMVLTTAAHGIEMPNNIGLFGGYPGCRNQFVVVRQSNVEDVFNSGYLPSSTSDIHGREERLEAKSQDVRIARGDVMYFFWQGGGGYGDPLDRDPQLVAGDVSEGLVSRERASEIYGVELDSNCKVDVSKTEQLRNRLRALRVKKERE